MKRVNENPPARFPSRRIDEAIMPWWIAKIKPRQEKAIALDFVNKNIEYYLPMVTRVTRRKDNNKPRKSIVTLFSGYISFCSGKAGLRDVFSTGRVVNIIEIRHQKKFIAELSQIYFALEQGVVLESCTEEYIAGTTVIVRSGPLKGIKGVVSKTQNRNILILSVDGLGQAAISVDSALVSHCS
jgi:transcription antitermination factor NusG